MRATALGAIVGLVAAVAAAATWALGGATVTTVDRAVHDGWLRAGRGVPASPALVLVQRDAASEARFGQGSWDRAVLARVVAGLGRAGAAVIGLDVPVGAPGEGGPAADALLGQATASSGVVVFPIAVDVAPAAGASTTARPEARHPSWGIWSPAWRSRPEVSAVGGPLPLLAQEARALGHTLALPDPDGLVRTVPLFVRLDGHAVPALGLALAAAFLDGPTAPAPDSGPRHPSAIGVPVDGHGAALVPLAPAGPTPGMTTAPFSRVWAAIETRQAETLAELVDGRLVVLLVEPPGPGRATPVGPLTEVAIHVQLAGAVLAGALVREPPAAAALGASAAGGLVVAGTWLALGWWAGLGVLVAVGIAHVAAAILALDVLGLALPLWPAIVTLALAGAGAIAVRHLAMAGRAQRLEDENARVREALARHESAVEALEEDLEAARAAVERSTGAERELGRTADALRTQLQEARAQEDATRRRLSDLERALDRLRPSPPPAAVGDAELERLRVEAEAVGIVTRDPGLLRLFQDLQRAARATLAILVVGEPGTGKELFARAAHLLGPRARHPFVPVNMAAIPPELFESELFGHVRGSFTGAVGDRKGYFEQAHQGTIFLDEIGELRLEQQAKLLRALQEKSFYRVGAARPTAVDVRVVAASNRDLERGVAEGWFREDLYFRLKGIVLRLPPLRERPADVPALASRLFAGLAVEAGREGLTLSAEAVQALARHDWPGNIRELENVLRQAVALAGGPVVGEKDLRLPVSQGGVPRGDAQIDDASDAAVLASLRQHRFDMQATARALGWDRSTVTQRLKGLGFRALVESRGDRAAAARQLAGDETLAGPVAVKLREYHAHLLRAVASFPSAETAVAGCRRRFKNLPERHFRFLEILVRQHFDPPPIA